MITTLCLASLAFGWGPRSLPNLLPRAQAAAQASIQDVAAKKQAQRFLQGPVTPRLPPKPLGLRDLTPWDGDLVGELGLAPFASGLNSSALTVTSVQRGAVWVNGYALFYFTVTITTTTNFVEKFIVAVPTPLPQTPAPMLVAFHSFGVTAQDIVQNTRLIEEAHARRWYLVAPLGASGVHFSSIQSQINTQAVLDWMLGRFQIDRQRIYAIGFSMGGGAATNYVARHLDPNNAMFAAVADHTGVVALEDVYVNDPSVKHILDFWFGNGTTGSATPFKLKRSSIFNFNQSTLQVDTTSNLARNLMHVPFYLTRASVDLIWYLPRQNDQLDLHLQALGKQPGAGYEYVVVPFTGHTWAMLNFTQVCDWLALYSLQLPLSGDTLADQDGNYFHFAVQQDQVEVFTPFSWEIDLANNRLHISQTGNLARLRVDTLSAQLDPAAVLTLVLSTADGLGDEVVLCDLTQAPGQVLRDNVPAPAGSWSYSALADELTIIESDGAAQHTWSIVP